MTAEGKSVGSLQQELNQRYASELKRPSITVTAKDIRNSKVYVGGEVTNYTKLIAESREQSLDRMVAEAEALGANAIVSIRFAQSSIAQGAAELLVWGTAVVVENE